MLLYHMPKLGTSILLFPFGGMWAKWLCAGMRLLLWWMGSALAVLDFVHLGSALSLRGFARSGSALAVCGNARFGSAMSLVDVMNFGS